MGADFTQALHVALRNHFPSFLRKTFNDLNPGHGLVSGWHLWAIAHQLERVRRGECRRLIINLPPRSLKSTAVSVAWPAYLLGHDPTTRIICASYSRELAYKLSNDFRSVVGADWYRAVFPSTRISGFKDSQDEVEFGARGFRLATSVGGTLTGRGGDIVIIDDPLKPSDALSEAQRGGVNQWFANTLLSRLDDKRRGAIIIVMQRVHMDDLTGFVLGQGADWTVLSLPAIATHNEQIPLLGGGMHHRREGDVLSPEREPLDILKDIRRQLGSDLFTAQYQQAPIPPGGAMIKRAWVQRWSELPPLPERWVVIQSWDTAMKGGPDNDWSVCTTWVRATNDRWFLVHVWRGRVDYPSLKAQVQAHANAWQPTQVLMEESGTAIGLLQECRFVVRGLIGVRPDRDKVSRLAIGSAMFEAGQIFFPERADWLPELEAELFAFPGGRHDDQVDSISQALLHGKSAAGLWALLGT